MLAALSYCEIDQPESWTRLGLTGLASVSFLTTHTYLNTHIKRICSSQDQTPYQLAASCCASVSFDGAVYVIVLQLDIPLAHFKLGSASWTQFSVSAFCCIALSIPRFALTSLPLSSVSASSLASPACPSRYLIYKPKHAPWI